MIGLDLKATSYDRPPRSAIVFSGGGARGAYEAGVLHYIRSALPRPLAERAQFRILCGSSVGAITTAFMASLADRPLDQGEKLLQLWKGIRPHHIYRPGPVSLGKLLLRGGLGMGARLSGIHQALSLGKRSAPFMGLFDTQPFFHYLLRTFPWPNISRNLEKGCFDAVVVSAINLNSGDLELFVQKAAEIEYSSKMFTRVGSLGPRHVLASAALPILFPPVPIHGVHYSDGSFRLNTPLAPALNLGADRILIVGTRAEKMPNIEGPDKGLGQAPSFALILARFFDSFVAGRLESDLAQVERINRILEESRKRMAAADFATFCAAAKVRPITTLSIFPSRSPAELARETVGGSFDHLKSMGILERAIIRLLEIDEVRGAGLLSYFLFEESYLGRLIDLGYEDAKAKHDELVTFLEPCVPN